MLKRIQNEETHSKSTCEKSTIKVSENPKISVKSENF